MTTVDLSESGATTDAIGLLREIGRRPRLAALAGALCIAFSGIFYRKSGVRPDTATFFRCFYGLPLLTVVALAERRRFGPLPRKTTRLCVVAGLFFAADLTLWHHSIEWVGAGLATVLGNLQVVIVGALAWLLLGERPSRRTLSAIPIVLAGVALISGLIGSGAYGKDPVKGVLLGSLTAVAYAGYLMVMRRGSHDIRRTAGPVALATAVTGATSLLIGLATQDIALAPQWPAHGWLLALGITSQSTGYLLISLSLPRLPSVLTSIILLAQPVGSVALSMLLLDERPSGLQLLGVALVIGGIALATVTVGRRRVDT